MAKKAWMILHIPSGDYIYISHRFTIWQDSVNCWPTRNKAYWAIINAINEHNDVLNTRFEEASEREKEEFAQANVSRGSNLFFTEFEIRRVILPEYYSTDPIPQEE